MGHLHDDIIYYYDQHPSGFSFLVQITAFVMEIWLGLPNLNMKRKTKRILVVKVNDAIMLMAYVYELLIFLQQCDGLLQVVLLVEGILRLFQWKR